MSGGLARRKERKRNRKKVCQGGWIGQKNETDGDLDRTQVLSGKLAQDEVKIGEGIFRERGRNGYCQGSWQRRVNFSGKMDGNRNLSWEKRDCQGNWKGTKGEYRKVG